MEKLNKKPTMPFAWLPQSVLNNPTISLKAKGLWMYINSKPVGWNFSKERMSKEMKEGIKSIRNGLRELEKAGYLQQKRTHDGFINFTLTSQRSNRGKTNTCGKLVENIHKNG